MRYLPHTLKEIDAMDAADLQKASRLDEVGAARKPCLTG